MRIHHNIVHVIIIEEAIPDKAREFERVMEYEGQVGCLLLHVGTDATIEISKRFEVRVEPRFVDWLKSEDSRMVAPFVNEHVSSFKGPVNVLLDN